MGVSGEGRSGLRNSERLPSPDKSGARDPRLGEKKKPEDKVLGKKEGRARALPRKRVRENVSEFLPGVGKEKNQQGEELKASGQHIKCHYNF